MGANKLTMIQLDINKYNKREGLIAFIIHFHNYYFLLAFELISDIHDVLIYSIGHGVISIYLF